MQEVYFVTIRIILMFQRMLQEEVFLIHSFGVSGTAREMIPAQVNQ